MNKKRIATSVAAVATAAAVLVGGTFAWQSISQTALNEASDVVNPGGRLHNDMWYVSEMENNNDIYVENFADEEIYARVRLSEYMEVVLNYGTDGQMEKPIAGSKTLKDGAAADPDNNPAGANLYDYTYDTHYFGQTNATDEYWEWVTGSADSEQVYYMPTFNLNKDSLAPDLNGLYRDRVGGISNREATQYVDENGNTLENYEGYAAGATMSGYEIYDGDANDSDEVGTDPLVLAGIIDSGANSYPNNIMLSENAVEHEAAPVGESKGMMSMADWLTMVGYNAADGTHSYDETQHGGYWVYDTDGWVYWSGAIGAGESTGLLLDGTKLNDVMDDSWYYAIEAKGEFITANDLGEPGTNNGGGNVTPEEVNPYSIHLTMVNGEEYGEFYYATEESSYNLTLRYEGEDYTGEDLIWSYSTVTGTVSDKTTIENGVLTVADTNMGDDTYAVINVTAALNGEEVVSENLLIVAFRNQYAVRYGFRFYDPAGNPAEIGTFDDAAGGTVTGAVLTSGVEYTFELAAYFVKEVDGVYQHIDISQYVDMPQIDEVLENAVISTDAGSGRATEEEARLSDTAFVGYVTEEYPDARTYGIVYQTQAWAFMAPVNVVVDNGAATFNLTRNGDDTIVGGDGGEENDDDLIIEGGAPIPMPEGGNDDLMEEVPAVPQPEGAGTGYFENGITAEALIMLKILGVDTSVVHGGGTDDGNGGNASSARTLNVTTYFTDAYEDCDGQTIYLHGYDVNNWYMLELSDGAEATWSVELTGLDSAMYNVGEPGTGSGDVGTMFSFYDCNSFGTAVITATVDDETYTVTLVVSDIVLNINDYTYADEVAYVHAGAIHRLSAENADSYELISTGHQLGTYISENNLYVDENETVEPVIKVTTTDGSTFIFGDDPIIPIKSSDEKWVFLNGSGYTEITDGDEVCYDSDIIAYYEGTQAYVSFYEKRDFARSLMVYSTGTIYANTAADATGDATSIEITVTY